MSGIRFPARVVRYVGATAGQNSALGILFQGQLAQVQSNTKVDLPSVLTYLPQYVTTAVRWTPGSNDADVQNALVLVLTYFASLPIGTAGVTDGIKAAQGLLKQVDSQTVGISPDMTAATQYAGTLKLIAQSLPTTIQVLMNQRSADAVAAGAAAMEAADKAAAVAAQQQQDAAALAAQQQQNVIQQQQDAAAIAAATAASNKATSMAWVVGGLAVASVGAFLLWEKK